MKKLFLNLFFFLTIASVSHAQLGIPQSEHDALVNFYNAAGGGSWNNNTNWLSDEPVSTWYGVTVADGHVTEIIMQDNNLVGHLTDQIGALTELTFLQVSANKLSGELPSQIGALTKLKGLLLQYNQFTGELPSVVWTLKDLEKLYLSVNSFTGQIPKELGNLSKLVWLFLDVNKFSGQLPDELGQLTNLTHLLLDDNNEFTYLPDLSALDKLEYFQVDRNAFTFEDLIRANTKASVRFRYQPQDKFHLGVETELYSTKLSVAFDAPGATYSWYRNGIVIEGASAATFFVDGFNSGSYYCKVTHPKYPDLALISESVKVDQKQKIPQAERDALVSFYNAAGGDNWYNNTNWLSEEPVSSWYGITVTNGHVSEIIMQDNNLVGHLTDKIGMLTDLTFLQVSANKLSGKLPPQIGSLTKLKGLLLNYNQFSGELPAEVWTLTNLEKLYLSVNKFTGQIPRELGNLSKLVWLFLDVNEFSGPLPEELGQLTGLTHLLVDDNDNFTYLPDLSALDKLEYFQVDRNAFTFEDLIRANTQASVRYRYHSQAKFSLIQTTSQRSTELSVPFTAPGATYSWYRDGVPIEGVSVATFTVEDSNSDSYHCEVAHPDYPELTLTSETVTVEWLLDIPLLEYDALVSFYNAAGGDDWYTNTNWLSKEPVSTWYGITVTNGHVTGIELKNNNLKGSITDQIGAFTELTNLQVHYNGLSGELPPKIGALTKLRTMYLQYNAFSGELPAEVWTLTSLEHLYLSVNKFTGQIPKELGNLSKLTRLLLDANKFSGQLPDELGQLTDLEHLMLNNNDNLTYLPDLSALDKLEQVQLDRNAFTFEDLVRANVKASKKFRYSPQAEFELIQDNNNTETVLSLPFESTGCSSSWFRDNEQLNTETVSNLKLNTNEYGDFHVTVSNADFPDFFLRSKKATVLNGYLQINSLEADFNHTVFPNPTTGRVTITSDVFSMHEEKDLSIYLFDNQGKVEKCKLERLDARTYSVNLENAEPGVHFLSVRIEKQHAKIARIVILK